MTKECFAKGMSMFLTNFANLKVSKLTQAVWFELLSNIPDEQFTFAVKKICLEVKDWYPTTNFVAMVREQFAVDMDTKALLAWEAVVKTMAKTGAYTSVKFDDPAIHSVVLLMAPGWAEFCHIPLDKWMYKYFIEKYKILAKRDSHPEYLKGIHEIENTANGYLEYVKPPKQIDTGTGKQVKQLEAERKG